MLKLTKINSAPPDITSNKEAQTSLALEIHKDLREQYVKKMILSKLANRFSKVMMNAAAVEEAIKESELLITMNNLEERA